MYRHTQFGTVVVATVGTAILVFLGIAGILQSSLPSILGLALMGTVLYLFRSLTVEIAGGFLKLHFGPGLIRKTFRLDSIREAQAVRNRWYYGWGIRLTPHGWLFNVSGLDAVQIKLENGRQYRIGTDEPLELLKALQQACGLAG